MKKNSISKVVGKDTIVYSGLKLKKTLFCVFILQKRGKATYNNWLEVYLFWITTFLFQKSKITCSVLPNILLTKDFPKRPLLGKEKKEVKNG